jgi:hypothetical protein
MIVNNLQLKLKSGNEDALLKVKDMLLNMRGQIPTLVDLRIETDIRHGDASYDLLLIATFDSMQDFDAYLVHPVHQDVARNIADYLVGVAAVCYEA